MVNPRRMDLPQIPQMPAAGPNKVLVFHKETGEAFERWPIDAREMLGSGSYQMHPPGEEAPEPEYPEQQEHVKAAERLLEETADPVAAERAAREAADEANAKASEAKPAAPTPPKKKPGPKPKGQGRTSVATARKKGKGKGK
jgi:hypothetical protein